MSYMTRRSLPNPRARLTAAVEPLERRLLLTSVVVNTTADVTDAPGSTVVSLRDAVNIANNSTTPTTITFSSTVFATAKTITLSGNELEISGKQPVAITGPAAGVTVNGNGKNVDCVIDTGATATVSGLTITGGAGGIENNGALTLKGVTVSANTTPTFSDGVDGAAGIENAGTLTLTNSTVANNTASAGDSDAGFAGGIVSQTGASLSLTNVTVSGNQGSYAGGILNGGTATLSGVTISDNVSSGLQLGAYAGLSGGIENGGTMTLTDCTVSGNSGGRFAGGIGSGRPLTLDDSTIAGNDGPGIFIESSTLYIANSIVAGDAGDGDVISRKGGVQSSGFNIIGDMDGSTGWISTDLTGTTARPLNAFLSPLGSYGGPTQTMVPLTGSPAIDHGSNALIPGGATTDQRGFARVVNGTVDIGAAELQRTSVVTITPPAAQTVVAGVPASIKLGSFTDPGGKGPLTVIVNWGDHSPETTFSVGAAGSLGSQTHTFTTTGAFTGTIFVVDTSGNVSQPTSFSISSAATITGTVFNDANGDGTQDNGEAGLAGVQVYADLGNVGYFVTGDPTTTTNATGGYTLSGLLPGSYIIRQVRPLGDAQTAPGNGLGHHVTVSAGQTVSGQNFGDKSAASPPAAITGTVFDDANGDGTQDNGETGLAGVQVYLDLGNVGYFVTGDPTTVTNATGGYTLSGLAAGNYIVRQALPLGYVQTNPGSGFGHHVTVSAGQSLSGQTFGDKA